MTRETSITEKIVSPSEHDTYAVQTVPLGQLFRVFLVLGLIGFGGPAAHLALMERELVVRRKWLTHEHFLDLLAAINLVPGPNSTEMAIHIGYLSQGVVGMLLTGAGFILPAVIFSSLLGYIYVNAGQVPTIQGLLLGVKPIILVLILSAAYRLGRKALDNRLMWVIMLMALLIVLLQGITLSSILHYQPIHVMELVLLIISGLAYVVIRRVQADQPLPTLSWLPFAPVTAHLSWVVTATRPDLIGILWNFLVIGATLFGSGYVLVSYMQRIFVDGLGWLTHQQLLDVLAIGQSTPGPVSSTAAAAGYIMMAIPGQWFSGVPGAVLATVGIFLPAFITILLLGKFVPYLRRFPSALTFLKGVNAGVIALLIGTFIDLSYATLWAGQQRFDWLSLFIAASAFVALERKGWSPIWLTLTGAVIGIVRIQFGLL